MESATWNALTTNGRPSTYSYGRPYVEKPSFDSLPLNTLESLPSGILDADLVAAEWERVESLFERNWFGPCNCLYGVWGSAVVSEPDSSLDGRLDLAAFADSPPSTTAAGAASAPFQQRLPLTSPRRQLDALASPPERPVQNGLGIDNGNGTTTLYGLSTAPIPEPPFPSNGTKDASPLRPVPVPRRLAAPDDGGDGPLPAALPIEPPAASPAAVPEPVPKQPAAQSRLYSCTSADDLVSYNGSVALAPQLGTWADRQYRLLEPVPERAEWGPGSASVSGNSAAGPSPVDNQRSPDLPPVSGTIGGSAVGGAGGGTSNGSGGCGSGDYSGGASSSAAASQAHGTSPTLLDLLAKPHLRGVRAELGDCQGVDPSGPLELPEVGLRAASASLTLTALQRQALQQTAEDAGEQVDDQVAEGPGWRMKSAFADMDSEAVQAATEAVLQEAAWRWRFTRRWQAEQARTGQEHASSVPADQLEEALAYLQATNATTTVSMQIANGGGGGTSRRNHGGGGTASNMSLEGSLALQSLVGTLGGAGSTLGPDWPLGAYGSGSGSFTSGPRILGRQASGELLAASREVASLNRRAAVVLQQQLDCEQQAERRIQESLQAGAPWVGQHIPVVQIDEWGSFRFLMLKLRDQSARAGAGLGGGERQRILIRGHNYGSEGQLIEECNREIMSLAHRHNVPFEAPTVMGGGVMEWRRDRDRHLHLHSGFVMDRALPLAAMGLAGGPGGAAASCRPASAMDLLNLAAALARQTFPPTYKITVLT